MEKNGTIVPLLNEMKLVCQCETPRRCQLAGILSRSLAGSSVVIIGAQARLFVPARGTLPNIIAHHDLGRRTIFFVGNKTPFTDHVGMSTHCRYSIQDSLRQVKESAIERARGELL